MPHVSGISRINRGRLAGQSGIFCLLAVVVVAVALAQLSYGPVRLSISEISGALFGGGDVGTTAIIGQIRGPRILLGVAVGVALSLSGCHAGRGPHLWPLSYWQALP